MTAKTKGKKLISLTANRKDVRTDGKICARGFASERMLYDPDRLKYPLKRVGERGEGKWSRIGWGEAIDTISLNLEKLLTRHGPESIGLFANGPSSKYITELFRELKINNIANSSYELCHRNKYSALQATFGTEDASAVFKNMADAKCIVLFGSHFGENVQADLLRDFLAALNKGAKLIVIDPRTSVVAGKADHHLMLRPGTDTALLLGWIQYILKNGFYNKNFVDNYTIGVEALRSKTSVYDLDLVASLTDTSAREIQRCAEILATSAPDVVVYPGNFSAWYGNDIQRLRALAVLSALLSDKDSYPSFSGSSDGQTAGKDDRFSSLRSVSTYSSSSATLIREAGKGNIKLLGCWGQNPFQSTPNPYRTIAAFQKAEFTFCCDVLPTETSLYADIILPEATFLERMDGIETWDEREQQIIALRYPVLDPLYESKDPYFIVKQLSSRLGVGEKFEYETIEERLNSELNEIQLSVDHIKRREGIIAIPKSSSMDPLHAADLSFPTPSGRIELYSEMLFNRDESPLPEYISVPLPPKGFVRLLNGKSPVHYGSACNNDWLNHEINENELWLNDEVAEIIHVQDGEKLFLENQDGIRSLQPVKIKVTPGIRVDCVFLAHGFGADSPFLSQGFNRGVSDNSLLTRSYPDPVSGARGIRVNFIRIIRDGIAVEMPQIDSPHSLLKEKSRWWFDSFGSFENGKYRKKYV
jgi:thiosulfate reductase/polysulfide reductase chain A